jgi:hypothetical protein
VGGKTKTRWCDLARDAQRELAQPVWLLPPAPQLTWLDREAVAFSHALAIQFGYSGRNTLSNEAGYDLARRLGVSMQTTKRWFHYGIGGSIT